MKYFLRLFTLFTALCSTWLFAAAPTSGQFLFQRKNASGPFEQFGVTPVTGQTFGWNGSAVVMFGPGGGITWGSVTGTLSNQTDLQSALNAKLSLSGVLPLAGFSSITGTLPVANIPGTIQRTDGTLALGGFSSITGTLADARLSGNVQLKNGTLALAGFGSITGTVGTSNLPTVPDNKLTGNVQLKDGTLALGGFGSITGTVPAANVADLSATYLTLSAATSGYQPLDGDLTAIAALSGTNTIYYRSAANTWTGVTVGTGLSFSGGTLSSTASGGTVTSVALTAPGVFSVAGSPVTTTGTLALSLATQTANSIWSGPATGSAATPTFRALVAADIPDLSATYLTLTAATSGYQPLDGDLTAIAALTGTNTMYYRSAANTWTQVAFGSGLSFSGGTLSTSLTGTVTSVAATVPSILAVSGSPVTTSGTLAFSLASQSANLVFAGPNTGSATTPTFRALVSGDIPDLSATYLTPAVAAADYQPLDGDLTALAALSGTHNIYYRSAANTWSTVTVGSGLDFTGASLTNSGVTSVALSLPAIFTVSGSPVTTTGTLTGTLATQTANLVFAGPTSGSAAAPTFRSIVAADVPDLSATYLTPAAAAAAYQPLDGDLTALAALSGTNNIYYRSAANTWTSVTVGTGLSFSSGTLASTGGSGTVTSVALSLPGIFTVSGSPVTTSGTLTGTLATQSANRIFAGPTTGGVLAPTFRALVAGDFPDLSSVYVSASTAQTANTVLAGPATGAMTAPTWRALVAADIPSLSSVYQPLDGDLTALAALAGTNTIYYRSAANTWTAVTVSTGLNFSGGLLTATATLAGSTGATDNSILRADGTGGATVQNSGATIADDGTITAHGIAGVITVSNADAGSVGEYVNSLVAPGSAVSLADATAADVTNISLTAGDWDVEGSISFLGTTATLTGTVGTISLTTGTLASDGSNVYNGLQTTVATFINGVTLPRKRVNVSSTTTVYLVGRVNFSAGTVVAYGTINARRVR